MILVREKMTLSMMALNLRQMFVLMKEEYLGLQKVEKKALPVARGLKRV